MQRPALFQFYTTMSMRSKFTRCAPQRKIRAVRRTSIYNNNNNNIWKIADVSSMWGFAALAPIMEKYRHVHVYMYYEGFAMHVYTCICAFYI